MLTLAKLPKHCTCNNITDFKGLRFRCRQTLSDVKSDFNTYIVWLQSQNMRIANDVVIVAIVIEKCVPTKCPSKFYFKVGNFPYSLLLYAPSLTILNSFSVMVIEFKVFFTR